MLLLAALFFLMFKFNFVSVIFFRMFQKKSRCIQFNNDFIVVFSHISRLIIIRSSFQDEAG
ncbi:MAG: hypothetical protein D3914_16425 [Candidatus Electrothrix sp. LOE2]|nr:hypothetical protein [Candidatus Electrothrix sp. LOE2]